MTSSPSADLSGRRRGDAPAVLLPGGVESGETVASREAVLRALQTEEIFDLLVIGGGATGCGVALDAASRGLKVALAERGDFASGTSGRSTKLIHGGVRYLEKALLGFDRAQFNLVREALHERSILLGIAPHLCRRLQLIIPLYRYREIPYYFAGLKIYDLLAGKSRLSSSKFVGSKEMLRLFPTLKREGLKGGARYCDGQFNDARMNLALALTALDEGAALANHLEVVAYLRIAEKIAGVRVRDLVGGTEWEIHARCVINASGPWSDQLRLLDDPHAAPLLQVSSGIHIALAATLAPAETGLLIPRTDDGRVLFILPWLQGTLVGTTDRPASPSEHPEVSQQDVEYLLRHLDRYLDHPPKARDIAASWAGIRPLVASTSTADTANLARDHVIHCSPSGLITITGGKWTTYRKMAQDTVDYAVWLARLSPTRECRSDGMKLHGSQALKADGAALLEAEYGLEPEVAAHLHRNYGDRAGDVAGLCRGTLGERLVQGHPYLKGEVLYAVREEWAVRPLDFLARRIPLAVLDAKAAREAALTVIELMGRELSWDGKTVQHEREYLALRLQAGW